LVSLRKNQEAEKEFLLALKEDTEDPQAHYFLGALLVEENRVPDARKHLESARSMNPDFWGTYYYLAKLRLQMKEASEAIPLLEKAAKLNPAEPSNYFLLASELKLFGRDAESKRAIEQFERLRSKTSGETLEIPR
jgi:predicted Zn-dependent protease